MARHTTLGLFAALALSGGAHADTIVGNLTWTAGQTVGVDDDLVVQGTLTVEAGVTVNVEPGFTIVVANGGTLSVNGTEGQPVVFQPASARWGGVRFEAGSTATLTHAAIRGTQTRAVRVIGASPVLDRCEISDVRAPGEEQDVFGVLASDDAAPELAWCRVFDIVGPTGPDGGGGAGGTIVNEAADGNNGHVDGYNGPNGNPGGPGGDGKRGGDAVGVRLMTGSTATISYSSFSGIEGGSGGAGGFGGSASRAGNGGDGIAFFVVGNGGKGGNGANGGAAGHGADGGNAAGVWASDPSGAVTIYQNLFHDIRGGSGGKGGRAGYGSQGGSGGDGADTDITFVCGGNGGNGGSCGRDSDGGPGGDAGWANAVAIENAPTRAVVSQNTIADVTPGDRGERGDRLNHTTPSYGGYGGTGGWPNYCEGSDGSGKSAPNNGANGAYGAYADGAGMMATNASAAVQIQAVNNVFAMGAPANAFAFNAGGSAIIASDSNLFDSARQEDFFTGTGTTSLGFAFVIGDPAFVDAGAGDYRLGEGSAAIDAGDSFNVAPLALAVDLDGNPRVFDDPGTANAGLGDPIDMGAYEYTAVAPCPADLNGDGVLNFDDLDLFVAGFLAGDAVADLTGDGTINFDDLDLFVASFLDGCG